MDDEEINEFLYKRAKSMGRCFTDSQKEEFMVKLLELWKKAPALRFGQLIDNAYTRDNIRNLYYDEDDLFLHCISEYIDEVY